jgi:hypothetical protein
LRPTRIAWLSLLALLILVPFTAPVGAQETDRFTCRASVVRVDFQGALGAFPDVEPFVANEAGDPCTTDDAGLITEPFLIPTNPAGLSGSLQAVYAATAVGQTGAFSAAGVLNVQLALGGHTIGVEVLTAEATATCPGPSFAGDSTVVGLTIDGQEILIPEGHFEVTIPGVGTLHLNETTTEPNRLTQQAFFLDTALVDVVIAEAVVDAHGKPCGRAQPSRPGWMTGGGRIDSSSRTTHALLLQGDLTAKRPSHLVVSTSNAKFKLEVATSQSCSETAVQQENPQSGFDTIEGSGIGTCNGLPAMASWRFTDAGEPGRQDTADIQIEGGCALVVSGRLAIGNHQAHGLP